MTVRPLAAASRPGSSENRLALALLNAAIVGLVILAASLFGNFTRPVGHLSAFWPANALLLGLMVRNSRLATPLGLSAAAAGYIIGDLIAGATFQFTVLLTAANMCGAIAGYLFFSRLNEFDRLLKRPLSVLYLVAGAMLSAAAAAVVGAAIHPILFSGTMVDGWIFWFVSEVVNYVAILPVILTLPVMSWQAIEKYRLHENMTPGRMVPAVALVLSAIVAVVVGGPGAVAFPVPALLWCALTYRLFATATLTLLFSVWTLLAISTGLLPLSFDNNDWPMLMSIRIGVTLIALGPITVASVMASRNELMIRLQHLASHDQLTDLLNRNAFREQSVNLMRQLAISKRPAALLMLDIDRFKTVNDTYGHAAGDRILAAFAKTAGGYLRKTDTFGRLGGEEFAILLGDCAADEAEAIAERIRMAFAETVLDLNDGRSVSATVSIGVVSISKTGIDMDLLLAKADEALYRAKHAGRNRVERSDFPTLASSEVAAR